MGAVTRKGIPDARVKRGRVGISQSVQRGVIEHRLESGEISRRHGCCEHDQDLGGCDTSGQELLLERGIAARRLVDLDNAVEPTSSQHMTSPPLRNRWVHNPSSTIEGLTASSVRYAAPWQ